MAPFLTSELSESNLLIDNRHEQLLRLSESGSQIAFFQQPNFSLKQQQQQQHQQQFTATQNQQTELTFLESEVLLNISNFIQQNKTFQLSSFGPTGMVILDLLSKSKLLPTIPVVFIDTLHHFEETYQLVERVKERYPEIDLRIYKPKGCETRADFERKYGTELWDRMPSKYAYYTKVEPRDRAMAELDAKSYINGRRKSQGNKRGELSFLEHDDELDVTRVQPLFNWTFDQVWAYIRLHNVPYNALHDQGYKSIGDFMSTSVTGDGEDERAGRWKGKSQTECGLHLNSSEMATLIGK